MWDPGAEDRHRPRDRGRIVGGFGMSTRMVEVRAKVLKQNDLLARALRERFRTEGTCVVGLGLEPGSRKAPFLEKLLAGLARGPRVGALVGDLATENDA